jgi:hypothetical protein
VLVFINSYTNIKTRCALLRGKDDGNEEQEVVFFFVVELLLYYFCTGIIIRILIIRPFNITNS